MKEMKFRKLETKKEINNNRIENIYKRMYDEEFNAHMRTKEHFLKELDGNVKLMEENDRLEKRIYELEHGSESENKYDDLIKEVNIFWGDTMPMMAMEEAGEFIQAVSKIERANILGHKDNLVKEMADMMISIRALMFRYGIEEDDVFTAIDNKLSKQY